MSDIVKSEQQSGMGMMLGSSFNPNFKLKPAFMELVQRTTRDPMKVNLAGKFVDSLTYQAYDKIDVVVLRDRAVRPGYYEKDQPQGSKPICFSRDNEKPDERSTIPQSPFCASCDHAQWGPNNEPPECGLAVQLLFIEANEQLPYLMTAKGVSVSPINKMLSAIQRYAIGAGAKGQRKEIYDYMFTITSEFTTRPRGSVFMMKPSNLRPVEDASWYAAVYAEVVAKAKEAEAEAAQAAEEAAAVDQEMPEA